MKYRKVFSNDWSEEIAAYMGVVLHVGFFVGLVVFGFDFYNWSTYLWN